MGAALLWKPAVFSHWPGFGVQAAVVPKGAGLWGCQLITLLSALPLLKGDLSGTLRALSIPMHVTVLQHTLMYHKLCVLLLPVFFFCKWN